MNGNGEIQYIGEHLLPGYLGHFGIILSFVTALLAMVSYFLATRHREDQGLSAEWAKVGRWAFGIHGLALFTAIGCIFYAMLNQYYEYQYVQAHVSADLDMRYIFSAFWEGQEGSFLLWLFWHVVLGGVLIATARKWEFPVMTVVASVQVVILTMILGVYIGFGDYFIKIGSNPTLLLRDVMDAPIFAQSDYVKLLQGTGLNPLLQNYWMTIHPPTLFLGFASTIVPFAFAVAGLWTGDHKGWLRAVQPWALFSAAILGIGILMGAAWAYEALNFGGYWAWDPVENTSLVPWLILVAGLHTNLIARATGHSIRATYVYYLLTFVLIVYSTFLTRSGILGETSVHAFTEMGLENQLLFFIGSYLLLSIGLLAWRYRSVPAPVKEESTASKEFWMFIGSLVLLFSAILITASTSLPVYNKIVQFFDPTYVGQVLTDPEPHYNKYQVWIGVFIGLLSGFSQFLRWREQRFSTAWKKFAIHTGIALVAAVVLTIITRQFFETYTWQYTLLMVTAWFVVVTNLDYVISFTRHNLKASGSAISHIGFGLMIVGILASGLNKEVISNNPFLMEGLTDDEEARRKTILLFEDSPMIMEDYELMLTGDTIDKLTRTFIVNYKRRNAEGEVVEEFNLKPNVLYDKQFSKIAAVNPSTKHYLTHDVFTVITHLPEEEISVESRRAKEDSLLYQSAELQPGASFSFLDTVPIKDLDTFEVRHYSVTLDSLTRTPTHPEYEPEPGDIAIGAILKVKSSRDEEVFTARPMILLRGELAYNYPVQLNEIDTRVRLEEKTFESFLVSEGAIEYQEVDLAQGESVRIDGLDVRLIRYNPNPSHPDYQAEEGDITAAAELEVTDDQGQTYQVAPLFLIRDSQPMDLKAQVHPLQFHARFVRLDPKTGKAKLLLGRHAAPDTPTAAIGVAPRSYRSDWIALQATVFPGINFFWLGSLMMMVGLLFSMVYRLRQPKARE